MGAPKGFRPVNAGIGRKKGVPNKLTQSVKDAFKTVFDELQGEPGVRLLDWAKTNPSDFYKVAAKLIPQAQEVSGPDGGEIPVSVVVEFKK